MQIGHSDMTQEISNPPKSCTSWTGKKKPKPCRGPSWKSAGVPENRKRGWDLRPILVLIFLLFFIVPSVSTPIPILAAKRKEKRKIAASESYNAKDLSFPFTPSARKPPVGKAIFRSE